MTGITETKLVEKETITGYECDNCHQKVDGNGNQTPSGWHYFSHLHHEWGNDSIESHQNFHVCSVECYTEILRSSIEELDGYQSAEIDEMNLAFAKKLLTVLSKRIDQ